MPLVLGRASPASVRPAALRSAATASSACYRADGGDGSGWALRAATVAGVSHRLAGLGPQDAYAWKLPADAAGTVVVAVADGVGGVEGSAAAAAAAVEAVCDAVEGCLSAGMVGPGADPSDPVWRAAFAAAGAAVKAVGGATTLVVAVLGHGAGDAAFAQQGGEAARLGAVARVGDSGALVRHDGAWSEVWPASPSDDAPVSTATAALAGRRPDVAAEVAAVRLGPGDVLALVTDGVANPWRDGPTTVAPALATVLEAPPSPLGLALAADFSRQGCFDDRTIVGVWPLSTKPDADATPR